MSLQNAPERGDVQDIPRGQDGGLAMHAAELWPHIQTRLLKVDHGEAIVEMVDWERVHAPESFIWRNEQDALAPSHLAGSHDI